MCPRMLGSVPKQWLVLLYYYSPHQTNTITRYNMLTIILHAILSITCNTDCNVPRVCTSMLSFYIVIIILLIS